MAHYLVPTLLLLVLLHSLFTTVLSQRATTCSLHIQIFSNSTCVWTNESAADACTTLNDVLSRSRSVNTLDCVDFAFNSGVYNLTVANITISYSVVMRAIYGGVTLTCGSLPGTNPLTFSYLIAFAGPQNDVTIDGLHFTRCSGPLKFTDLAQVSITNSNFSNFVAQPTDIFNCWRVDVINCIFYNSNASTGNDQYHGNSGGLTISYHSNSPNITSGTPTVAVSNCRFYKNSAFLPSRQLSTSDISFALNNRYYYARGGGFGLILDDNYFNITATISNCNFDSNNAGAFGGGLYIILNGKDTHHNISVVGCTFLNNFSARFGGGIQIAFLLANQESGQSQFRVNNCSFTNNQAQYGGGISTNQFYNLGQGNYVEVTNTNFTRNNASVSGSGIVFVSFEYTQNRETVLPYLIQDCNFVNNTAPVGVIAATFQHFIVKGFLNMIRNFGPGLRIIGALVHINGSLSITNNDIDGHEGGALYVSSFGQVKLYQGSEINLINNSGMIGAAIVVDVQKSSKPFSQLINNPQCFLTFDNATIPPRDYKGATVTIKGNTASVGPAIYISHLDLCSWISFNNSNPVFDATQFPKWAVLDMRNNTSTSHANSTSPQFYVQTEAASIESLNSSGPFELNAGKSAQWNLIGRDQFGNPTYFIAELSDSRDPATKPLSQATVSINTQDADKGLLILDPALAPILPGPNGSIVQSYFEIFNIDPKTYRFDQIAHINLSVPYNILNVPESEIYSFSVKVTPCYPGYELKLLQSNLYQCSCVDSNPNIICDKNSSNLFVTSGYWAGASYPLEAYIKTYICPASYCLCQIGEGNSCIGVFNQNDTENNKQCHPTRKGILCGQCTNRTAVGVLRRNCRECQHEAFYAIPLIVLWDVTITLFIMLASVKVKVTFAPTLRGLLFYIQMVYYATEYFPASFWDARQYMLYVGSALSLYFPWDFCLYPGATSLQMSALQFITPATVLIVVIVTLLVIKKSNIRRIWHGVLTLILLIYPSLVHNCMSLLHCPTLPDNRTSEGSMRWFVDGTVQCFGAWQHILIALLAILILVILSAWIPFTLVLTTYQRIKTESKHNKLIDHLLKALKAGYKKKLGWWISVEFLRRFLLIAFLVFYPGRTVIPIYILIFATVAHAYIMPYKRWWQNLIELAVLTNFIFILLLRSTQSVVSYLSRFPGVSIPGDRGAQLAEPDNLTKFFAAFFYFPLAAALLMGVAWIIYRAIIYRVRAKPEDVTDDQDRFTSRYTRESDRKDFTTSVVEIDGKF